MTGVHGVKAEASVIQGKPVKNQPRKHSIRYQPSPSATPFRHALSLIHISWVNEPVAPWTFTDEDMWGDFWKKYGK